jgi:putative transposase
MRESRFTEEQIIGLLKQAEAGRPVAELCRQAGITDTTFYKWRSKFAGLEVSEARRLRQLEEENRRLKGLVADRSWTFRCSRRSAPALRRQAARQIIEAHGYSGRRACQQVELNRRTFQRVPPDRDEALRNRLRELAEERRRFGCPRIYLLLRREGLVVNHKRVERLYREEALPLRLRQKRKRQTAASPRTTPIGRPTSRIEWSEETRQVRAMNEENQNCQSPNLRMVYSAG